MLAALLAILFLATPPPGKPVEAPLECRDHLGNPKPEASAPLRLDQVVTKPEAVKRVYPPNLQQLQQKHRTRGMVMVEAIIDRNGRVCVARLAGDRRDELAEAFRKSLLNWEFKPGMVDGKPVPVFFTFTVNVGMQ